jgi:hypothetical protein
MSVQSVVVTPTLPQSAKSDSFQHDLTRPRYLRDFIWFEEEPSSVPSALATEFMLPVPTPPINELSNLVALHTIRNHPHLFKIITPINVDRFGSYLLDHPNRSFVDSVCQGLRDGFWPWAITDDPSLPVTWDNSHRVLKEQGHVDFVREQRDVEIQLGQFSPSFGPDLLPGMYSMPIGVVPKPHSNKLRMVVDQSAEPFSLNSMIPKHDGSIQLDNLRDLGRILRNVRKRFGNTELVVFKSDVSRAYRLLPVHPLWQIRQIITIDGQRHVNRCNHFGNRAAGRVWGCFIGLVLWIAIFIKGLDDMLGYVDDIFSWELASNTLWYDPYNKRLPAKQCRLLQLWDELGIPHEEKKQVFGAPLTIIGLDVDPNAMTITMPVQARTDLILAIRSFAHEGQRRPLREFQSIAGWINWAFNAYPLLRPGLSTMYAKMSGKDKPHQSLWVSRSLCRELEWIAGHLEHLTGVHMMNSLEWDADDADEILYTDACPTGMGFWSPRLRVGFQHLISNNSVHDIFYLEALAVLSALAFVVDHCSPRPSRVAIFTDNTNSVNIFHSLHARPPYNPILLTAVDLLLTSNISLRVFYIPGQDNVVADALSRFHNDIAIASVPELHVSFFQPPRLTLGASKK